MTVENRQSNLVLSFDMGVALSLLGMAAGLLAIFLVLLDAIMFALVIGLFSFLCGMATLGSLALGRVK